MRTASCPFSAECQFQSVPAKTPSDVFSRRLYCYTAGYAACEIAKKILGGRPVPPDACPLGNVRRLASQSLR
jgi:hypothetical protein